MVVVGAGGGAGDRAEGHALTHTIKIWALDNGKDTVASR